VPALRRILAVLSLLALPAAAFAASPITGTVTNKTTNKPAAGDTVTLIRLAQGMQEATHTKTDSSGHFSLDVPDDGLHLVRVTHDGANYFRPAPAGTTTVDLDVFNAAPHVKGVVSEAEVLRLQTDAGGTSLRVVENFFLKNDSHPPLTQFSNVPFDFWLPQGAVVEGAAAQSPDGMPVRQAPVPLAEPNHYTFLFPIRPGETRFQVTYRLPYTGKLDFNPRPSMPTDTVAIMMPKSMTLTPAAGAPYAPVDDPSINAQTIVARSVTPTQPLGFTLSGTGQLPRDTSAPDQGSGQPATQTAPEAAQPGAGAATADTRPGGGLGNPLDAEGNRDPWAKYKWWILSGLALLLAAAAGILLRKPSGTAAAPSSPQPNPAGPYPSGPFPSSVHSAQPGFQPSSHTHAEQLLHTLKEELFALETDHLQHRIAEPDYLAHKAALELILRRALQRSSPAAPATPAATEATAATVAPAPAQTAAQATAAPEATDPQLLTR
jgi:hypothetical protein